MTPQDIVDRIIDLGLNGADADSDMPDKALGWLNMAYSELYGLTIKWGYPLRQSAQTVIADSTGLATLENSLRNILSVYDVTNNKMLNPSDVLEIEKIDPSLVRPGNPCDFYVDNIDLSQVITDIRVHPVSAATLRVRGIATSQLLALDGVEDDIKLPVEFHEALIWSGLLTGSVYERGFGNDSVISLANARKSQLHESMQLYFADTVPHAPRRTKGTDF